mmetsp:Transcript_65599/g.154277  ORF Transcript_65599/g.154277 Transcript_65599/m.154277 type:complete len:898 (+) Transcript_65599:26-2719(+)
MAAAKVATAFNQLSPKGNGIVPWRVLEDFLQKLDVEPRAIQACKSVQEPDGSIDSARLFQWLYDAPSIAQNEVAPLSIQKDVLEQVDVIEKGCLLVEPPRGVMYEEGKRLHYEVPPHRWCVTRPGFLDFVSAVKVAHSARRIENRVNPHTGESNPHHDDENIGPNMHSVNNAVIKPRTEKAGGMSWALMLSPQGLTGEFFFVTHSWKEGVYEFSRKVLNHWQEPRLSMWCCFLANPQTWDREDLNQLLGERFDLSDSPFMQALSASSLHSFVVVPNVTESLYCRLWCVAELWKAMELEAARAMPLIFVAKDTIKLSHQKAGDKDSISTMIHNATCSDENDKKRIRAYIQGNEHRIQDQIKSLAARAKAREQAKLKESKHGGKGKKPMKKSAAGRGKKVFGAAAESTTSDGAWGASATVYGTADVTPPGSPSSVGHAGHGPMFQMSGGGRGDVSPTGSARSAASGARSEAVTPRADTQAPGSGTVAPVISDEEAEADRGAAHRESHRIVSGDHEPMFKERIERLRQQVEFQRHADDLAERALFQKLENLEYELGQRRHSIEIRMHKENDREALLLRNLAMLETAQTDDLKQEIRIRTEAAMAKERRLEEQLKNIIRNAEEDDARPDRPTLEEITACEQELEKQLLLCRQLHALASEEGEDTLRRHLTILKKAELEQFLVEVKLHRQSDESTEAFLAAEVGLLREDLHRHMVESDSRREQAKLEEEAILHEMERLTKEKEAELFERQLEVERKQRKELERHADEEGRQAGRGGSLSEESERRKPMPNGPPSPAGAGEPEMILLPPAIMTAFHVEVVQEEAEITPVAAGRSEGEQEEVPSVRGHARAEEEEEEREDLDLLVIGSPAGRGSDRDSGRGSGRDSSSEESEDEDTRLDDLFDI